MKTQTKIDEYSWKESETIVETKEKIDVFNVSNLRASIDQLKANITKRLAENISDQQEIAATEAKIAEGVKLGIIEK